MAIASRNVWRESRANRTRLNAKRTAERRSTSRGVTPFVENTFWDRLGSFWSVEAPAQSLKVKTWATSRKLAATKSTRSPIACDVNALIEKATPMRGAPWRMSTSRYRMHLTRAASPARWDAAEGAG